jgi:hypothetical protein
MVSAGTSGITVAYLSDTAARNWRSHLPANSTMFTNAFGVQGKMLFVTLDNVLWAIGARVEVRDSVKLADHEAGWMRNMNESFFRYSEAAALLDYHLVTRSNGPLPRWLDTQDGTGYPRPSETARDDGMAFLLEQAQWYRSWQEYNRKFLMRSPNVIGRWGNAPPTSEEYAGDCPQLPASSEKYARRIHEIVFDAVDITAFLDRSGLPYVLAQSKPEQELAKPGGSDRRTTICAGDLDGSQRGLSSSGVVREPETHAPRQQRVVSKGRKCPIEKAILEAMKLAGADDLSMPAVREKLTKLAVECPNDFPPLIGYKNGQIVFGQDGRERVYTSKALGAFLSSRKRSKIGA